MNLRYRYQYRTVQNKNNEMKTLLVLRYRTVPGTVPVPYQNNDLRYYSYDIRSTYNHDIIQEFLKNDQLNCNKRYQFSFLSIHDGCQRKKMTQMKKETPNIDAVFDLLTENPALLKQYTMK